MPSIRPKNTTTAAPVLVWDAFPPPPPEADTWQPDPDSIAKPGCLPDPRFNRDPENDRRSKSFEKEAKMYATSQPAQNGVSSSLSGLGEWPAPSPRRTGYPRDFINTSSPPSPRLLPMKKPFQTSESQNKQSSTTVKPVARINGPPKGTMELMSTPNYRRPETPVASRASAKSESPSKNLPPAWAASLEKALAEDDRKLNALAATAKISTRPETSREKSIPPHLRTKVGDTVKVDHPHVSSAQSSSLNLNPNAKVYEALVKREENIKDNAFAWNVATADPGIEHAKQDLCMQREILDLYIAKQPVTTSIPVVVPIARSPLNHGTKIKVMLIRAMEHELDLGKVAPERELMAMQRAELDRYYEKVCSAHQQWWEATGKA